MDSNPNMPTFGIGIMPGQNGKHYLSLDISTGFTEHHFYIGEASNYEANAKSIFDGMMAAGKEAARMDSGLVVMDGMNGGDLNAIVRAQGRKQGTPRRKG